MQVTRKDSSGSKSPHVDDVLEGNQHPRQTSLPRHDNTEGTGYVHDVDDANMQSLGADETSIASVELPQGRSARSLRPSAVSIPFGS